MKILLIALLFLAACDASLSTNKSDNDNTVITTTNSDGDAKGDCTLCDTEAGLISLYGLEGDTKWQCKEEFKCEFEPETCEDCSRRCADKADFDSCEQLELDCKTELVCE